MPKVYNSNKYNLNKEKICNGVEKKDRFIDIWFFTILIFIASIAIGWLWHNGVQIPLSIISIIAGILGFTFWVFIYKKPISEIYYKGYPYRKLKVWGVISSFIVFEYILAWGLHSRQLQMTDQYLYSITVVFIGSIAFYFSFVRMKVSLRYLFLGIFIPILASGAVVGLGKYFGFINFSIPKENVTRIVLLNTCYWIIFNMLYHLICEEPAFRGFLTQRLLQRGKTQAIIVSSLIFAIWRISIGIFQGITVSQAAVSFFESFTIGCLLAVLFIKGKNLLIAAISHGIIDGLRISLFAGDRYSGLDQYFTIANVPFAELKFITLWISCLFIGVIIALMLPQKRRPQYQRLK